ncbi:MULTISPECIES: aminotransferase class I/II-fold pyridoxal phosphate-dependent enzyme [unclassified Carboxylicivirga]|uniref:aminotransferase class I/II-fold pyridoxal phosphate-dependent enzyme n=1 Tax=Carboxylicivirga TaxID=1628153 RepID=UPI003D34A92B
MQANRNTPIDAGIVDRVLSKYQIEDLNQATIREVVSIVNDIEEESGEQFIRMEMGVPGLEPSHIATNAEIEALKKGVASKYPMLDGIKPLKEEASRFVKAFLNLDIAPECCVPTVGSMQGSYANFLVCGQLHKERDTLLFIDPGFPVQKQQLDVLGYQYDSFDVYNYRGEALRDKLEAYFKSGKIAAVIYSNPNNPSWVCFTELELKIIGELATQYDVVVIEDLAYFAMDFRQDLSKPFEAPYQVSVGNYTDNYVLLISSSKAFSYAGQRISITCMSNALYKRRYDHLKERFGVAAYGQVLVTRVLYALSSGTCHSAQYALAALLKAANDGQFNFLADVKAYQERGRVMKSLFLENGFHLTYDKDIDQPLADGFYFTVSYKNLKGGQLLEKLLYYGISAITLGKTGSQQDGLRACVSQTGPERFDDLRKRLEAFHADNP